MKAVFHISNLWQIGPDLWSPGSFWALFGVMRGNFNELLFLKGIKSIFVGNYLEVEATNSF